MDREDILIYDLETDGKDNKSNMKWFGAYSYLDKEYYLLDFNKGEEILNLLKRHSILVGFNNIEFDNPILTRDCENLLKYKNIIDLLEVSKKRLPSMGISPPNFKLKTICETLKLDEFGKLEIDYKIFQKDEWNEDEVIEIKKYLKQDIVLTKKLFEWFQEQFKPLKKYLSPQDQNKIIDVKSSLASLSYKVICNSAGIVGEFTKIENKPKQLERFEGGHHIEPRNKMVRGNIISVDFTSAYPHAILMNNLITGTKTFGKFEQALNKILLERLKAKREGDKIKSQAYKIVINSLYGLLGNWRFKTLYNPKTAGEVTKIVRTWLKRLAKTLEENGFYVIYGFTDNVICLIPEWGSKEQLKIITDKFIQDIKLECEFPLDTFKLELEKEMKFIWFVAKNCYLWVDNNNKVGYKSTLLNSNTPKIIMNLFESYISPKIIKELDVKFTEQELTKQLKELLKENLELAGEEYNVSKLEDYKVKTSLHYQISEKYGEGKHFLIPNLKNIGVGKGKKYCSFQEFKLNNLTIEDVDTSQLIKHLKPFYKLK